MPPNDPWRKPQPDMVDRFHAAVSGIEGVEVRKMFGMPAAFLNGNMVAGLHQDTTMVRLPDDIRAERLAEGWSGFEPMPGRPMREYVALPPDIAAEGSQGIEEGESALADQVAARAIGQRAGEDGERADVPVGAHGRERDPHQMAAIRRGAMRGP